MLKEKPKSEAPDLASLELKANLNPEQRPYLEVLKAKMKKILGNKTKQELAKAGDLVSLNKYRTVLADILKFLQTKELLTEELIFTTPEGKEVKIEMEQQLEYWADFYQEQGIDWISMPEKITLTTKDREELTKGGKALCPDGNFEKLKLLIIPAGLADNGEKYAQLHLKMSEGYYRTYQSDNFKEDGGFEGLRNKSDKLRIILVKDVHNIEDDELYKSTRSKSADDLEEAGGIFEQTGLIGIDGSVYLVWQREYFKRTGKHLDGNGNIIWLTENRRSLSGRVANSRWFPNNEQLAFDTQDSGRSVGFGCRLSSSREK